MSTSAVPGDKGANAGLKVASLVAATVAGADSIKDMALLRHGGMGRVFQRAYAASTLASFLRAFAALRKLVMLDAAEVLDDLKVPPGNRLEALKGDRVGQHSIRINQQWRICFVWTPAGPENVEIVDYH